MSPDRKMSLHLLLLLPISNASFCEGIILSPTAEKSTDPLPPAIVTVLVAPVPVATTPEPTKFIVVAAVLKLLPSS